MAFATPLELITRTPPREACQTEALFFLYEQRDTRKSPSLPYKTLKMCAQNRKVTLSAAAHLKQIRLATEPKKLEEVWLEEPALQQGNTDPSRMCKFQLKNELIASYLLAEASSIGTRRQNCKKS